MSEHMQRLVRDINSAFRVRATALAVGMLGVIIVDELVPTWQVAARLISITTLLGGLFVRAS